MRFEDVFSTRAASLRIQQDASNGIAYMATGDPALFKVMNESAEFWADVEVYKGSLKEVYGANRYRTAASYTGNRFKTSHPYYGDSSGLYMTYVLTAGDGIFCNSNALHSGHMRNDQDCTYLSVTFHPRFLYGYENSILHTKYVANIVKNESRTSLALTDSVAWQSEILDALKDIYKIYQAPTSDYEIRLHMILMQIWYKLYLNFSKEPSNARKSKLHLERLRNIISFIEQHYHQEISLEDVAKSANICKSECCRFFKKHMGMTIFDYVLYTRIQNSLTLLTNADSITEVASQVGFSSPSYYSQIFKRYMKCTPMEYKGLL